MMVGMARNGKRPCCFHMQHGRWFLLRMRGLLLIDYKPCDVLMTIALQENQIKAGGEAVCGQCQDGLPGRIPLRGRV